MSFVKKNFKYVFIFFFSLLCMGILLTCFDGDVLWNYGFSYAISRGEVPYMDFNMILTPFYSFLMSIGLLFHQNILVFYIENSLLIVLLFYLLFQLFQKKAWLFLVLLIFPIPAVVFPSYNLFLIFLVTLLIYLEENHKSDYLIGFVIGISILTKQSVGFFLIIPSLIYYHRDLKRLGKRFLGLCVPCILFLLYLIFTHSFSSFFNLCFLGLFDFSNQNGCSYNLLFFLGIFLIFISCFEVFKNRGEIRYLYVLMFSSIMIPLFDLNHIEYFLFVFCFLFVEKLHFSSRYITVFSIFFSICFANVFFFRTMFSSSLDYPNHYDNFNFRMLSNQNGENKVRDQVINFMRKNQDKKIIFLASDAYFYKITCHMDITYFDLLNKGNHGYHGDQFLKRKLDQLDKGTIVIIDGAETYSTRSDTSIQFNRKIAKYAAEQFHKIKSIAGYWIYIVE